MVLNQAQEIAKGDDVSKIKDLLEDIDKALTLDRMLPEDHPEKENFKKFNSFMLEKGAIVNKCKPRWDSPYFRYVHAVQDIYQGEDVLAVPLD